MLSKNCSDNDRHQLLRCYDYGADDGSGAFGMRLVNCFSEADAMCQMRQDSNRNSHYVPLSFIGDDGFP